jgi:predicted TIM-barrel fold metal-dependent hydrolase
VRKDLMRSLLQRVGVLEAVTTETKERTADHETRLRALEHLTAKVVGGAIVGSAVGGWILTQLNGCT